MWQRECGTTPIRALDQLGFLTPRTVLVHCVILDDGEIDLLRERGCHVVHCPTNHMKLAKGFTRVPDLLRAGVNVCIGLDGSSDMLVEMRSELGMHAAYRLDPTAVSKLDALRMATIHGARALGLGETTGLLAPGRAADLVLIDRRSLLQAPIVDPLYTLLYATHAGMIRHVLVDGRVVVRDGHSTLVDEDALLAEAEAVIAAYMRRIGYEPGPWRTRGHGADGGAVTLPRGVGGARWCRRAARSGGLDGRGRATRPALTRHAVPPSCKMRLAARLRVDPGGFPGPVHRPGFSARQRAAAPAGRLSSTRRHRWAAGARLARKGGGMSIDLRGKKVIAIGERDGVQGQAIAEAVQSAGAEVLLQITQCFV